MGQTQNIEQQIQLLSNLQLGFGIAALLFLALAIFLFFYLHIPQVFNEYRGKSAQKAMEEMAANSSDSGRCLLYTSMFYLLFHSMPGRYECRLPGIE